MESGSKCIETSHWSAEFGGCIARSTLRQQNSSGIRKQVEANIMKLSEDGLTPREELAVIRKTAQDLMRENPGEFEIVIEICKNGNGINGNGKMPSLKSLAVPFKVSDGPWLQRLRATFNGSKLQVERRTTTRS